MIGAITQTSRAFGEGGEAGTGTRPRSPADKWLIAVGYRWQDSFRHFRGPNEEANRIADGTQVENRLHLFDVAVSYQASPRWSVNASAPFMTVDRISHGPGTVTGSAGIGDMSVGAKVWLFKPPTESGPEHPGRILSEITHRGFQRHRPGRRQHRGRGPIDSVGRFGNRVFSRLHGLQDDQPIHFVLLGGLPLQPEKLLYSKGMERILSTSRLPGLLQAGNGLFRS